MYELTPEDLACLKNLTQNGCAVVVFLPQELGPATPEKVEEVATRAGWEEVEFQKGWEALLAQPADAHPKAQPKA